MAEPTTTVPIAPTGPTPTYKVNQAGVKNFAGRLNSMGEDGNRLLSKWNSVVQSGDSALIAEKAAQLQAIAKDRGYEGDLFGNVSVASPRTTTAEKAPGPTGDSSGFFGSLLGAGEAPLKARKELAKSGFNALLESVTGLARTPQILHDVAGAINEKVFGEQTPEAKADSKLINDKLKGLGDFVAGVVDQAKVDEDKSGQFSQGLYTTDEHGDTHWNNLAGSAQAIGQSLGFAGSMLIPGKILGVVGKGATALRVAKAAGDVEKVAALAKQMQASQKAMAFIGGTVSQTESLYQDALEATGDSRKASLFTATVAPVVAAIDAFTGVENVAFGGKGALSKVAIKQILAGLGGEVSEETFKASVRKGLGALMNQVKTRAIEGGKQTAIEGVTEGIQEGYQMGVEKIFDKVAGNSKFTDKGGAADARLINAVALGGLIGGPMGAVFHQTDAYHPTAFKVLQDAYADDGESGVYDVQRRLQIARANANLPTETSDRIAGQIDKMVSVVNSFKGNPKVSPLTQFQYYDLNYNQVPKEEGELAWLQTELANLTSDAPVDEDGYPIDPAIAATQAAQLETPIADQQRRVDYMKSVLGRLTKQGVSQDYGKGYDQIGKFQPGDRIVGPQADNHSEIADGTVTAISPDGQTLTVEMPAADPAEPPVSVDVRAIEAAPYGQAKNPTPQQDVAETAMTPDVSIHPDLVDGFVPYSPTAPAFEDGRQVILASHPDTTATIRNTTDADGNKTLTISTPDGDVSGTLEQLTDPSNPNRIIGDYSPIKALQQQQFKRQQIKQRDDLAKLKAKLPAPVARAIDHMSESQLSERLDQVKGDSTSSDEKKYIEYLLKASQKQSVFPSDYSATASPETIEAQRTDTTIDDRDKLVDSLAPDTPKVLQPIMDAGEEVISDDEWNQMAETDLVPVEILTDMVARKLSAQALTDRQQAIYDGLNPDDEAIWDEIEQVIVASQIEQETGESVAIPQTTDDGTISEDQGNADSQRSDGSSAGEPSQAVQEGSPAESAGDVPGLAGSVRPELAQTPTDQLSGADGVAESAELPAAANGSQDGNTDTNTQEDPLPPDQQKALAADANKLLAENKATGVAELTDEEIEAQLQKLAGKNTSSKPDADTTIQPETVPANPVYVGPPVLAPAAVAESVRFKLNNDVATLGTVTEADGNNVTIEYQDRKGKTVSFKTDSYNSEVERKVDGKWKLIQPTRPQAQMADGTPASTVATAMLDKLKKAFPRITTVLTGPEEMQERFGELGDVIAAVDNGIVYIDQTRVQADTPLHEFSHVYNAVLSKYHPALYQRGLDLVKGSEYEQWVRDNYPHLTSDEAILEEALARAITEKGMSFVSPTKLQRFMSWAKLALQRISEKLGFNLNLDSTLDDYAKSRAGELLSGRKLSDATSEQIADGAPRFQKASRPSQQTVTLPSSMDEAWLAQNGSSLTPEQYKEIVKQYEVQYDPATQTYTQTSVDQKAEQGVIAKMKTLIDKSGYASYLRNNAQALDVGNLGRVLFGESENGKRFEQMIRQQLAMVAPMKTAGHDAAKEFYDILKGKSVFRGAVSYDAVEKWDMTGVDMDGKPVQFKVPVDVGLHMGAQYRSLIESKGHFDPKHKDKTAAGEQPTMGFKLPNAENPDAPLFVRLNKAELRALEDRVFYQDPATMKAMEAWAKHSDSMFPSIARIHRLMTGKNLEKLKSYFPLSPANSERDINARSMEQFVDDAGLLKNRDEGASEWHSADGFLAATSRYQHQAENFVQLSPLWQNLLSLAYRQEQYLANNDMANVFKALKRLGEGYRSPDADRNATKVQIGSTELDTGKMLQLATLSRFAFNIAIPLKQITGYFSALGSGAIDSKYLMGTSLAKYMYDIGESYVLVGRGSKAGTYTGAQTTAEKTLAKLKAIDTPDAHVLMWRMQGQASPDVYADGLPTTTEKASQAWAKARSWFEEYGLSITQRADTAVVTALVDAAEKHVRANSPQLSDKEVMEEAVSRAKEALYFSNQTFDRSDRASIQFARNPVEQILLLYKGQGVKIYNTIARRGIELAQADGKDKPAARKRLASAIAMNAVVAPLITSGINVAAKAIRGAIKDDDKKKDDDHDSRIDYLTDFASQSIAQLLPPGFISEIAPALAYGFANPTAKRDLFDVNPLGVLAEGMNSALQLALSQTKTYKSEKEYDNATKKALQDAVRAGSTATGIPMEAARQVNNIIGNVMAEDKKPSRTRRRERDEAERDYGWEYATGTQEAPDEPRRR